jgi:hypothetical protein
MSILSVALYIYVRQSRACSVVTRVSLFVRRVDPSRVLPEVLKILTKVLPEVVHRLHITFVRRYIIVQYYFRTFVHTYIV